jgi:CRISPR/Cas system CSM-associated protein Csm3 (group 7 of RAMP superfamily)
MLPFENGVLGVLHGHWELTLKTPLVIRSGNEKKSKAAFRQQAREFKKGRGMEMAFVWKNAAQRREENESEWSQVTDFNYHFFINPQNNVDVAYSIPASSVRGALRQWTIKSLVAREFRRLFSLPKKNAQSDVTQIEEVKQEIESGIKGWRDILSLFGCAFDLDPQNPLTWAGRLRLTTELISTSAPTTLEAAGKPITHFDGPKNMNRHINVRNPIDRVTMAAKDKGLHFGLEMSENEKFAIDFHILNPKSTDIRLLDLWAQDIQEGFLRFGGLTSQGRGRVELDEAKETYTLFVSPASAMAATIEGLGKPYPITDDLFADFWRGVKLTRSELISLDLSSLDKV